ncbi:dienelactone hydrolase family protein [Halegenticoccus tardaugens]|uniref:dienelactone hydrolase family protein n=1 Tax=Halegenticoccus tardaugens TaxID=2071624 RepID=UPI00100BC0E9|nr:hypothetical protein [Halegenticoccus tardaugens]
MNTDVDSSRTPDERSRRRRFLAASGALLFGGGGLAGCLDDSNDPNDPNGSDGNSGTDGEEAASEMTDEATEDADGTAGPDSGPESVSFEVPHGATIDGTLYGSGDCGIVLVPQINMDRESWKPRAEALAGDGRLVLAIDEDPDDRPASVGGAIEYLRDERDVSALVLIGASSGGEAVVRANANAGEGTVDGTVALSAGGGADVASDLQGRLLFVVSEGDDERFVRVARELHEGASEPKELVTYGGSAHGQGLFDSEHVDDLGGRVGALVERACGG